LFNTGARGKQGPHRESKNAAQLKTRFGGYRFALFAVVFVLFLWASSVVFSSNTDLLHRHSCFPCAKRYKAGGQGWRGEGWARAVPVGRGFLVFWCYGFVGWEFRVGVESVGERLGLGLVHWVV